MLEDSRKHGISIRDGVRPRELGILHAALAEQTADLTPQGIMEQAIQRHNDLEAARLGNNHWGINIKGSRLHLVMVDEGKNNDLAIASTNEWSSSYAYIGHYDPGLQRFLFYPEVVTDAEAVVLTGIAQAKRVDAMRTDLVIDTDAKIVIELRKKHREVLEKDGLVGKIAERYNQLPSKDKLALTDEVLIDDRTSYFVCLTPKLGGYSRKDPESIQAENLFMTDEAFVTIALTGDYFMQNGVKVRRASSYLHIGHLELDGPEGKYVPDNRLITNEEFAQILSLTAELQQIKATTIPSLDTELVALKK